MKEEFIDYYQLLEVNIFASKEGIRAAYKRLAKKHHPDNGGDGFAFAQIREAYSVLSDDGARKAYLEEWTSAKFSHKEYCKYPMGTSYEDLAFQPLRETVHEYMFYIMNREYDKAYDMLCKDTVKKIFKRDFIKWQDLVGQVHKIVKFDSCFESIEYNESDGVQVVFSVKVREYSMLLNRQEKDYFKRILIYEEGMWKVRLQNINIRQIIKKYKQIIGIHKRRSKWMNKQYQNIYCTKYLDVDSFMQNVEYEFLRYKRYEREFALISLVINGDISLIQHKLMQIVSKSTRITDSFCIMESGEVLILITETDKEGTKAFLNKFHHIFNESNLSISQIKSAIINEKIASSKEIINKVMLSE